jgi:hypothetical protein
MIILKGIQNVIKFLSTRVNIQNLLMKETKVTEIFSITGRFLFTQLL